ncbi:hypothetical protein GQ600_563 [Phytophthora cactorum]|nr:hypothetical protein GQ600_563 [Phytophthora cactorum]
MPVRCESCAGTWETKSGFVKAGLGPIKHTQTLFFIQSVKNTYFTLTRPAPSTHSRLKRPELKRGRRRQGRQLTNYDVFRTSVPLPATTLRECLCIKVNPLISFPERLTSRLFIKNGDPYGSCRNKVPPSPTFVFNVAEGYRVLRAKVEEHFESKIPGQWRADFAIYSKSANSAYQKDFQLIWSDSEALQTQLDTAWHKARLRNGGRAGFVLIKAFVGVALSSQ